MSVTRLVVVDEQGITYERRGVAVSVEYQDDGRTLKVFVSKLPADEEKAAIDAHNRELATLIRKDILEYRRRNPRVA